MAAAMAPSEQNPAIVYREIMGECQRLMQKIAELDVDRNEHSLVEETLKPLDPKRRAYRLVGEVLVERTVEEVLPSVTSNRENVSCLMIWSIAFKLPLCFLAHVDGPNTCLISLLMAVHFFSFMSMLPA